MSFNSKESTGNCFVTARLNLLGIDWMMSLGLWDVPLSTICNNIKTNVQHDNMTKEVMSKFSNLFSDGLGMCTRTKASMTLIGDAKPVFIRTRPSPFAALQPIEEEIMRGIHEEIYSPTEHSEFAVLIIIVKKKNGKIRLCGDYSTGLNDVLEPNRFPLPIPDQIFAALSGCEIFTVIDLSDAFLQVPLDDDAKKLLTINTHLGLFNVNWLQPGVKTALGIFQELMTRMLNRNKGAFAFIDDIILRGKNEIVHRQVLFEVLASIQEYGFKLHRKMPVR